MLVHQSCKALELILILRYYYLSLNRLFFKKKIIQTYQYVNDFVVRFGCIINCKLAELFLL